MRRTYRRRNPITNTELVVGGLVTAALVGVGGYFIYNHFQSQNAAAALPPAVGYSAPTASTTSTAPYDPSTYGPAPAGTLQATG